MQVVKGFDIDHTINIEEDNMVGERYKREPEDEAKKWRRRCFCANYKTVIPYWASTQ